MVTPRTGRNFRGSGFGDSVVSSDVVAVTSLTRRPRLRLFALVVAAALGLSAVAVGPAGAASGVRDDVSTRTDYVAQTNFVQCVGASMQMMLNMIEPTDDRTAREQLRLQDIARYYSGSRPDGRQRQGASVRGWSAGLNLEGAGPYRLVGASTLDQAMSIAARAISETGKPVGLLVWRGRHAWVMSGFVATADPAATTDFAVTHAVVLDPLYPHGSKTWGPSPKPREAITMTALGRQFVPRGTSRTSRSWMSSYAGQYVMVVPMRALLDRHAGLRPS
jgi:hypothetical protein